MISLGLASRANEGVKVRQPLRATITTRHQLGQEEKRMLEEELNIKAEYYVAPTGTDGIVMNFEITPGLKREGLAREVIRHVQQARKQAGLEVDDRIQLHLTSNDEELKAVLDNKDLTNTIAHETLAQTLDQSDVLSHEPVRIAKIDNLTLHFSFTKSAK
jgi:isoleucyl-tRNA synthetase